MIDLPLVEKFLDHLKREGCTERYRKNVRNYLAQWAEALYGKDLRALCLQDLKKVLNGWYDEETEEIVAKPATTPTAVSRLPHGATASAVAST